MLRTKSGSRKVCPIEMGEHGAKMEERPWRALEHQIETKVNSTKTIEQEVNVDRRED